MYAWKVDGFGHVVRAKVRLVARGFVLREVVDFFETFYPCPSVAGIRWLAAIACTLGGDLRHFHAEHAFVESKLDEDETVRLPSRYDVLSGKVAKLGRSLHGLQQASRT